MMEKIFEKVESYRNFSIEVLSKLIEIKALSPENGGDGESEKAEYVESLLDNLKVKRYDAKDDRVSSGIRPNIVAELEGEEKRRLWIVTHLDVVPEGDISLWESDPFKAVYKDGKVYGRGSEDNGQSLVASIIAAKALIDLELVPKLTLSLAFVSDEETGSKYGIQHLINLGVFRKDDLILVPDAGFPKGDQIEIAEKNILWLKITVLGKQGHASRPDLFKNANRKAMQLLVELDRALHEKFSKRNNLFNPPYSTFEPTKREKNVDNVNTIPGRDVSYIDCRVLPEYKNEEVIEFVKEFVKRKKEDFEIFVDVIQDESSPPTREDSEIVQRLRRAIKVARNIDAKLCGIGGNTCAAFFRKAGLETAVWSTTDGKAHEPNEYAKIDNLIEDAKVFALLPLL